MRARIDTTSNLQATTDDLVSLEHIMLMSDEESPLAKGKQEAYLMLDSVIEDKDDHYSKCDDRTLVVKRANLQFNGKSCVVLSFEDITAVKRLK